MELTHRFTIPASADATWAAFNDLESVAGCFPGATVTSVEGDSFTGSCKVKLGPIALVYNGSGSFVEKDEAAHRMVIDAKGKDRRGNGTAGAHVTATMSETGDGTEVEVVTDLSITGKPAQFGRGVMQDVSDKLLSQFVDCLESKVGGSPDQDAGPAPAPVEETGATRPPSAHEPVDSRGGRPEQPSDVLNLGATVLPVLVKSYGKQVAAGLAGLLVLLLLLRRRRR